MCSCIVEVNALHKDANTRLVTTLPRTPGSIVKVLILTEKIVSRKMGRARTIEAMFCPFCGQKYVSEEPKNG